VKPLDPRLLRYSRSSRGFIFATALLAIINAVLTICQAVILARAIVSIFQRQITISLSSSLILYLATIVSARSLINLFGDWVTAKSSSRIRNELRIKLLHSVLEEGTRETYKNGSARLAILSTKGINDLDGYFSQFLPQLFIAIIVPPSVGLFIFLKDWRSGVIALLTVPLIPLFGILIGRYTSAATSKKLSALAVMGGYFLDLMNGMNTLKVFGRDEIQSKRILEIGNRYRKETMKVLRISFLSSLALEIVATLSVALMAVSIGLRLVGGSFNLESGLVILILAPEIYWPIRQVASHFHATSDGLAVFEELYGYFGAASDTRSGSISEVTGIAWSDLTVHYEGREAVTIPAGRVEKGKVHLILGGSGSGKSTFASVIMGFLKPTSGDVMITTECGDIKLDEIDQNLWLKYISWLPQEPHFPIGSIRSVLHHAAPGAQDHQLIRALNDSGLNVDDLSHGLETIVGTQKAPLSIGQLRKVALARAILKPSPILILDEPSASVDDISEEAITRLIAQQALDQRLVLLISHRTKPQLHADSSSLIGADL